MLTHLPGIFFQALPFFAIGLIAWTLLAKRIVFPRREILRLRTLVGLFICLPAIWIFIAFWGAAFFRDVHLSLPPNSEWVQDVPVFALLFEAILGALFVWHLKSARAFAVAYSVMNIYLAAVLAVYSTLAMTLPKL